MTRLAMLRRNPKRTLAGLTVALVAVGVAIGSGASFTSSSSSNPSTAFTAGNLKQTVVGANALGAAATFTNIKPGWGTTDGTTVDETGGQNYGAVTVTAAGSLNTRFTVASTATSVAATGAPALLACGDGVVPGTCQGLDKALKVKLYEQDQGAATKTQVYDGLVKDLQASGSLGNFDAGTPANNSMQFLLNGTSNATTPHNRVYTAYFYMPSGAEGADNPYQGGSTTVNLTFTGAQTSQQAASGGGNETALTP
jgi:hypothetical protein